MYTCMYLLLWLSRKEMYINYNTFLNFPQANPEFLLIYVIIPPQGPPLVYGSRYEISPNNCTTKRRFPLRGGGIITVTAGTIMRLTVYHPWDDCKLSEHTSVNEALVGPRSILVSSPDQPQS